MNIDAHSENYRGDSNVYPKNNSLIVAVDWLLISATDDWSSECLIWIGISAIVYTNYYTLGVWQEMRINYKVMSSIGASTGRGADYPELEKARNSGVIDWYES